MTNKSAYQPEGDQSVIPYLHVNGAVKLISENRSRHSGPSESARVPGGFKRNARVQGG